MKNRINFYEIATYALVVLLLATIAIFDTCLNNAKAESCRLATLLDRKPTTIEKIVEKPVEIIKEVVIEKEVEIPVEITKEVIIEKEVEITVEVIKEIVVEKEIPVEVPIEVIKEVPVEVEKIVYIEVPVEVDPKHTETPEENPETEPEEPPVVIKQKPEIGSRYDANTFPQILVNIITDNEDGSYYCEFVQYFGYDKLSKNYSKVLQEPSGKYVEVHYYATLCIDQTTDEVTIGGFIRYIKMNGNEAVCISSGTVNHYYNVYYN